MEGLGTGYSAETRRWMTVPGTADYLGTTVRAIEARVLRGTIPFVKDGRRTLIDRQRQVCGNPEIEPPPPEHGAGVHERDREGDASEAAPEEVANAHRAEAESLRQYIAGGLST